MSDQVIIRIVREADAEDLCENIFAQNTLNEVKDRIVKDLQAYTADRGIPLVADIDGYVIGNMYLAFDEHPLRAHICAVHAVVVNAGFQRMGVARRLFEAAKAYAVEKGKSIMTVSVRGGTPAETVYRKLGFTEYGRLSDGIVETWEEGKRYDEVFFYLSLTASGRATANAHNRHSQEGTADDLAEGAEHV